MTDLGIGLSLGFAGAAIVSMAFNVYLAWKRGDWKSEITKLRRDLSLEQVQNKNNTTTIANQRAQLKTLRAELEDYDEERWNGMSRDQRRAAFKRMLSLAEDRVPAGTEPVSRGGEGGGRPAPDVDLGPGPHPDWVR